MTTPSDAISTLALLLERDAPERALARGWVDSVEPNGTVRVHAGDPAAPDADTIVECDRLAVTEGAELQLTGMKALSRSLGILATCIREAPEVSSRRRHKAATHSGH